VRVDNAGYSACFCLASGHASTFQRPYHTQPSQVQWNAYQAAYQTGRCWMSRKQTSITYYAVHTPTATYQCSNWHSLDLRMAYICATNINLLNSLFPTEILVHGNVAYELQGLISHPRKISLVKHLGSRNSSYTSRNRFINPPTPFAGDFLRQMEITRSVQCSDIPRNGLLQVSVGHFRRWSWHGMSHRRWLRGRDHPKPSEKVKSTRARCGFHCATKKVGLHVPQTCFNMFCGAHDQLSSPGKCFHCNNSILPPTCPHGHLSCVFENQGSETE